MKKTNSLVGEMYRKTIKNSLFLMTLLLPLIFCGIFFLGQKVFDGNYDVKKIGVVANLPTTLEKLTALDEGNFRFVELKSKKAAKQKLRKNKIDAYLVVSTSSTSVVRGKLYSQTPIGINTEWIISDILDQLQTDSRAETINLNGDLVAQMTVPARFAFHRVGFSQGKMAVISTGAAGFKNLLYLMTLGTSLIFIIFYGPWLAENFGEEKRRRKKVYLAKLSGVGLAFLTEFILWSLMALAFYFYFRKSDLLRYFLYDESLHWGFTWDLVLLFLFMFAGVTLFTVLATLIGLMSQPANRAKNIQWSLFISVVGFSFNYLLGAVDANNLFTNIASYIPLLSHFSMPLRLAYDTGTPENGLVAFLILMATISGLIMLTSRIYEKKLV